MIKIKNTKLIPLFLTAGIIIADQISKALVVANIPRYTGFNKISVLGDFFYLIHVRNPGIAFSIGVGLPDTIRALLFTLLPLAGVVLLFIFYFKTKDFSSPEEWAIAGILGGGIGNIIDRLFRPEGVVDFVDIKFYGLFGLERWPTFNIADSSVVVCGILLICSLLFGKKRPA